MREHNFTAGPAVLPIEVVEQLQKALPNYNQSGLGLMEMSHRSKAFDDIILSAKSRLRTLLNIPEEYSVLFLQGGASMQFYMSALNLLGPSDVGEYIDTGTWSTKAVKEAKRCSDSKVIWAPKHSYNRVPNPNEYTPTEDAVYLHYTSNNTIYGTQFHELPKGQRLVADLSSDICSRTIDVAAHELIYAGAQKNLGPSGVTVVILSPWAVERSRYIHTIRSGGLPSMLNYGLMVDKASLFNTPNTFGIYALEVMLKWLQELGGVSAIAEVNTEKSNLLYQALDSSDFWTPHAERQSRSQMNVTFKIKNPDLEPIFLKKAAAEGLHGLKGHRSVGGLRASIYNACPLASVQALVNFMNNFEKTHG